MTNAVLDLRLTVADGLATLTFDRPDSKVNLLHTSVMLALDELLGELERRVDSGEVKALLIRSAKSGNFIAGADIAELAALDTEAEAVEISRRGQEIFSRLEQLSVPKLAAINGTCVGGGLELVLTCDHRIAATHPKTRLGLPETRLGILPGLGGTVRLPRLIGLRPALDLILSGRQVSARQALELGLVDRILDADTFDREAESLGRALASGEKPLPQQSRPLLSRIVLEGPPARWVILRLTRKSVQARTRGHYPAIPTALEVTVHGLGETSEAAQRREAQAFGRLAATPECKSLIHVFQITEGAKKRSPAGQARPVNRAAVVGAGVMGAGIAELFAYQNVPVRVVDIDDSQVEEGLDRARRLLDKAARRSDWSSEDLARRREYLTGSTDYAGFESLDLVVEAVVERMEVKRDVFNRLEGSTRPDTVIATNTSALSVSRLQEGLQHPERVCGLHFFNPPHRMPLVELVRGTLTSPDTMATAFNTAVRLGKTPVVVEDSAGFVVNRVLTAYLTEAGHLLQEGAGVRMLDRLMSEFGMPVGPFRLLDEVGLDVVAEVSQTMVDAFGDRFAPAPVMHAVLATGVTGRKQGRGFYQYKDSKPKGLDPEITEIVQRASAAGGDPPAAAEARERMVYGMVNEAARVLEDGVVDAPESLDVAMIMGTGFPPFRGGLLRYADSVGLAAIADRLRHYAANIDARFEPASGLLQRNAFYDS